MLILDLSVASLRLMAICPTRKLHILNRSNLLDFLPPTISPGGCLDSPKPSFRLKLRAQSETFPHGFRSTK